MLMADLYVMIGAVFMDFDEVLDDEPTTYCPAVSLWITSVLAFALWALPDRVVDVEPDRFLAQFEIVYYNDPYVSAFVVLAFHIITLSSSMSFTHFPTF